MPEPYGPDPRDEGLGISDWERSDGWRADFDPPAPADSPAPPALPAWPRPRPRPQYDPPEDPRPAPPGAPPSDPQRFAGPRAGEPRADDLPGGGPHGGPHDRPHNAARAEPAVPDWSVVEVGTPGHVFEARPPAGSPYRPDTVVDGWSTDLVTMRLACVRGYGHRYSGTPREDDCAVAVHEATGSVVFAVADGVSAAPQSATGAALASRGAVTDLLRQLDADVPALDWTHVVRTAAWSLVARAAGGREPESAYAEEAERLYATTLVAGVVRADRYGVPEVHLVQVGDSGAWLLDRGDGRYRRLLATKDSHGREVLSSGVTPLPRVPSPLAQQSVALGPSSVLLVGTDGFGDALGDGEGAVGRLFHRGLSAPPPVLGFAHLLDFSRETFDDDRTLLAVWPRHLLPEPRR
ncbi:protein phosphatase 2C domain-containing protein [Actinacidiphila rubida]|uniref:Serine/threonine protein phosphatase PrpC n=1 Tax=Actinacidiphila rubida TaxID=310780 RepID=A0A1H8GII6_9ACTN|nr:protein phosphatase 2C domain-containing protein [Actinacidiphila rubida]SEN43826.1 Serine/threonine protein phosphatase PrpC [Actinacidiphila rubida]